jgi:hypothetical protein
MKKLARFLSAWAVAATILPPVLFYADMLELEQVKSWMLAAAVVWFISAPFWMEHKSNK